MDDFKDKIYAKELLAKAVELLPDPDETFFVFDIIKKLGDKALLAAACKKLLNLSDSIYMEVAGYLKDVDPNLAKECAVKAVENAKTRTEILHAATDVLEIFKDKGWAIEIVKNGIIDVM